MTELILTAMNAIESEGSQGYTENQLSKIIFDCVLRVHSALGPGLLINFNVTLIKNGIRGVVNNLQSFALFA